MPNTHLLQRLEGIRQGLIGLHASGGPMTSATKGREREAFVTEFLRECHPPIYRFGAGDITDCENRRSGQVDIVVEYPFAPSITLTGDARLYLAESVAAVVEVKSDIAKQWDEVVRTSEALRAIQRRYTGGMVNFSGINEAVIRGTIPLVAVGYEGWATEDTLVKYVDKGVVDGILVLQSGLFVSSSRLGGVRASGGWSLWGMIHSLHEATQAIASTRVDLLLYAR